MANHPHRRHHKWRQFNRQYEVAIIAVVAVAVVLGLLTLILVLLARWHPHW